MKRILAVLFVLMLLLGTACAEQETVLFGHYEQDGDTSNGPEPIEWIVVDRLENKLFLMSLYCLDTHYYHEHFVPMTWAKSDLRAYMNGEFMNTAFTAEEQAKILLTHVVNDDFESSNGVSVGGADTDDYVYLMSRNEALQYYPECEQRVAYPTEYTKTRGCYLGENGACWWWLRSPGVRQIDAQGVRVDGRISGYGSRDVYRPSGALRPVCWVEWDAE